MSHRKSIILLVMAMAVAGTAGAAELAKINGRSITDKDLRAAVAGFTDVQRKSILGDMVAKKQILNNLVDQEILAQEGEKEKLDQNAEYKDALAAFRKQYLVNKLLEKSLASKMTEDAAKKYYEKNKRRKFSTDQVHALHILVSTEDEAKDVLKKAKEAGADFQALAEKHSKDPTAKNNRGDLGYFTRDRLVSEFTDAAFDAEEGEIVGPVKTAYGYHVIKVVNKKLGKPLEYDEVELRVKNELRQELIQDFVGQIKKKQTKDKVQVNEQALDKIK